MSSRGRRSIRIRAESLMLPDDYIMVGLKSEKDLYRIYTTKARILIFVVGDDCFVLDPAYRTIFKFKNEKP